MKEFFAGARPGKTVTHGKSTFALPILYYRYDSFALYFAANYERVKAVMPSDRLHPILLPGGKAVVAIGAFNYIETSIGPYGELGVAVPVVFGKQTTSFGGLLAALMESRYPGFGLVVLHLPVTTVEARDAGRGEWGYTKFLADMDFSITPEYLACRLSEDSQDILELRAQRKGFYQRDNKPFVTYSVKNGYLIKTVMPQTGTKRTSFLPRSSLLKLGNHPVADAIRALGISSRPFISVYYPERALVLPSGMVIEEEVTPMEGYTGEN